MLKKKKNKKKKKKKKNCAVGALCVFIVLVKLTEWPPIGKIAAHSACGVSHGISA